MRKRSVAFWAVALLVALALAPASAQSEKVKLVFAGRYTPDTPGGQAWLQAIETYQELNPHIEIEYISEGYHDAYLEKLIILGASVGFPDVMNLYNLHLYDFVEQGVLDPIPADMLERIRTNLYDASLEGAEYKGVYYGVPVELQVAVLAYNKQLLAEAGVDGTPRTWDEMSVLAPKLRAARPDFMGLSSQGGGWGWAANWFTLAAAYGASYAGRGGDVTLNTPENVALLELIVDWFGPEGWADLNRWGFAAGQGYFGLAFPFWTTFFTQLQGVDFTDVIGVTSLPAGPAGIGSYQYGWSLTVPASSKNKEEAWRFVEWLATQAGENGMTAVGTVQAALGSVPTFRGDLNGPAFADRSEYFSTFIANLAYAVTDEKLPVAEQRQNVLAQEIEAAIARNKTPMQAMADAQTKVDALLAEFAADN